MKQSETPLMPEMFPARLAEVFRLLRKGRHLCRDDGTDYRDVEQNEPAYRLIAAQLGYELVRHGQGFYYLKGSDSSPTQRLQTITLFVLILFQDLEERKLQGPERMWEKGLLDRDFRVSELPHFQTAERRRLMHSVGVTPETLSQKVLRVLSNLGMADLLPKEQFRFRAPIYRFMDLCLQYASAEGWLENQERQQQPDEDSTVELDTTDDTGEEQS